MKQVFNISSFGWDVALCYAKEPLADDSEDERKIRRARKKVKLEGTNV